MYLLTQIIDRLKMRDALFGGGYLRRGWRKKKHLQVVSK